MSSHTSRRSPMVLSKPSSCVPAGAGGEMAELAPAGAESRTLELRALLSCVVLGATAARCLGKHSQEGAPHTVVLWH